MDTKELPELGFKELAALQVEARETWGRVLGELEKTVPAAHLELIKGIAGHLYVGGYMAGAEDMHGAIRGIK